MIRRQAWWLLAAVAVIVVAGLVWQRPWVQNAPPVAATATPTLVATVAPTVTVAVGAGEAADATPATPRAPAVAAPTPTVTVTVAATSELGTLAVYFLDVDQGDAILLMGPDFSILIDTGRRERSDVVPYLEEIGVETLDLLVGTHPDADHIGQFPQVLARFPVREVWMSGDATTTLTFERALDAVVASGAAYREPRAGEVYEIGSARLEVVHPTVLTGETNEDSVVFRLVFGEVMFLFMGDAEASSEHEMLEAGFALQADVLKLGHHGSDTSSTLEFLEAVGPEIAVWSAGADNTYGHPHQVTLDKLAQLGVTVYGTAVDGTVVVESDGQTYAVVEYEPSVLVVVRCGPNQININTATVEELEEIWQIGPARAQTMLALRPFVSVDDMVRVPGITVGALERIKGQGLACVE